jgi:hypothetical protein
VTASVPVVKIRLTLDWFDCRALPGTAFVSKTFAVQLGCHLVVRIGQTGQGLVKRMVGCSTILSSDAPPIADVSTFVYRHSLVTLGACSATEFSCPPAQLSSILPALACAHMATPLSPSTAELKERFVVSPLNYDFDICTLLSTW